MTFIPIISVCKFLNRTLPLIIAAKKLNLHLIITFMIRCIRSVHVGCFKFQLNLKVLILEQGSWSAFSVHSNVKPIVPCSWQASALVVPELFLNVWTILCDPRVKLWVISQTMAKWWHVRNLSSYMYMFYVNLQFSF